jgi:DNA invertase Pin-like site-specific DNA recombinase
MTPDARRRVAKLLFRLKRGDELVVHSLDSLDMSTGELTHRLRDMFEVGVALRIAADAETSQVFPPEEPMMSLIGALADHENRRPQSEKAYRRRRSSAGRDLALTNYQIEYARKMHLEGVSPRVIGLLFQASPDEIWQLVAK